MSLCIVIVLLLMVVCFLIFDLCLSAAIFPDDDMARSDS